MFYLVITTRGRNSLPQADCLRAPLVRLLPVRFLRLMQKRSSKTSADREGIYPRQKQPATGRLFARTLGALAACSIPTTHAKKK
ncbi:MAG: hypothetical protein RR639_06690 [Hydrogenoanaerobacterium sp.]